MLKLSNRLIASRWCPILALALAACSSESRSSDADTITPANNGRKTGPAAELLCESSGKNAWQTYGMATFVQIDKSIGAKSVDPANRTIGDPAIVGSGTLPSTVDDPPTFEGKLAAYLVWAYGGPTAITYIDGKNYTGPQDMSAAHRGQQITQLQYDYFVANIFVPSLAESGVLAGGKSPRNSDSNLPDDIASCFAPLVTDPTFAAQIVGQ